MKTIVKKHWKRYVVSSLLTFCAGFALVLWNDIDSITLETMQNGALVGILFTAFRGGVKTLLEGFLAWYNTK